MAGDEREGSVWELFGAPPPARTGRERLLATAVELFYARGIQAVGLDQIVSAAGVTKTTFYKHFDSKDQLAVEAVKLRDEWEMQAWERAVSEVAGENPARKLLAFFDVMDLWFNDAKFQG